MSDTEAIFWKSLLYRWYEDDACKAAGDDSRERVAEAWARLYDEPLPSREGAVKHDGGDSFAWEHPGGRVEGFDFDGEFIAEVVRVNA